MLVIRHIAEDDQEAVEKMYQACVSYNDAHNIHQWHAEQVTWEAFTQLYQVSDYYAGYIDETIVCGCFLVDIDALYWPEEEQGSALYLHKIVVHPAYRGRGYADELITYFKQKAMLEGYPCARIDVREKKQKLRQMYERNGFCLKEIGQFVPEFTTALYQYDFEKQG